MRRSVGVPLVVCAALLLALTWATRVQADVVGSVHDLTTATGSAFSTTGTTDQVCVFCHTPHGSDPTSGPLWNRQATNPATYTMYTSPTIDMTIAAGGPQTVSLACLSCHDGAVAFDVLINAPTATSGTYNYTAGGVDQGYVFTGADSMTGRGAPTEFGTDLTSEHPISITYNPALDPDFDTLANASAAGINFYGVGNDQVECASCHDPHDTTNVPFLRITSAASQICTTCHTK